MDHKKIILPTNSQVEQYSRKSSIIKELSSDPLERYLIKENAKEAKNKGKFCSTVRMFQNWRDMVKEILGNMDFKNDKG